MVMYLRGTFRRRAAVQYRIAGKSGVTRSSNDQAVGDVTKSERRLGALAPSSLFGYSLKMVCIERLIENEKSFAKRVKIVVKV